MSNIPSLSIYLYMRPFHGKIIYNATACHARNDLMETPIPFSINVLHRKDRTIAGVSIKGQVRQCGHIRGSRIWAIYVNIYALYLRTNYQISEGGR